MRSGTTTERRANNSHIFTTGTRSFTHPAIRSCSPAITAHDSPWRSGRATANSVTTEPTNAPPS